MVEDIYVYISWRLNLEKLNTIQFKKIKKKTLKKRGRIQQAKSSIVFRCKKNFHEVKYQANAQDSKQKQIQIKSHLYEFENIQNDKEIITIQREKKVARNGSGMYKTSIYSTAT